MSTRQLSFSDTFWYVLGTTAFNRFNPAKIIGGQPMAVVGSGIALTIQTPSTWVLPTVHRSRPAGRAIEYISIEGYERSVLFWILLHARQRLLQQEGGYLDKSV